MVSIIIAVKDHKDLTKVCLDSFGLYTDSDFEIIIVDDGSKEETRNWLKSQPYTVIRHDESLGWCKSINDGLKEAHGDFIVLSNNDIVATPHWDSRMLAHFYRLPELGLLGPTSTKIEGRQSVDFNKEGIDFEYWGWLIFFFVMMNRACLERVGMLDERFGLGGQDDADYCMRAREANFQIGIARDVYIYHYGSATFRKLFQNSISESKVYAESRQTILKDKYARNPLWKVSR